MKIFPIEQIREADKFTIMHEPVASIDLMERAAKHCVNWIMEHFDLTTGFKIVCGLGNNGGDGLAIARLLAEKNYTVEVFIINYSDKGSNDFNVNLERLKLISKVNIDEINSSIPFQTAFTPGKNDVIIDSLFGSGLNRAVEGLVAQVIDVVNKSFCKIISIDIPFGFIPDALSI